LTKFILANYFPHPNVFDGSRPNNDQLSVCGIDRHRLGQADRRGL